MKQSRTKKIAYSVVTVLLWLIFWQVLAAKIDQTLFLPAPAEVWTAFLELVVSAEFYESVAASLGNIVKGFGLACFLGGVLAVLAACVPFLKIFIGFPVRIMQAVPVASFTILALFWLDSSELSVLVSCFMVLPMVYTNVLTGIETTEKDLLEMAQVFRIRWYQRIRYIYFPAVLPHVLAACSVAAGLAWKSGIAAEVIGVVGNTIGNHLYQAKIYMEMPVLFAWTVVIIVISIMFERGLKGLLQLAEKKLSGIGGGIKEEWYQPAGCPEPVEFTNRESGEIRLEGVSKQFGSVNICKEFSMYLAPGERAALMGASGIGKTTIARMILFLEQADQGVVQVEKEKLAAVFQEDRLCEETTVYRNLSMVCRTKDQLKQIEPVLTQLGLAGCSRKKASQLSGGMKRRVAIARAFLADAPVLVLDEPLKGLDETTKASVMAFMKAQMKGKTVLYITHEEAEAVYFDCNIVTLSRRRKP